MTGCRALGISPFAIATRLVAVWLAVAVAGCGAATRTTSTQMLSASASARLTQATHAPTPTPTPSPSPQPTGFQQQAGGAITWVTASGEVKQVPPLNGIEPQLQDGKVVYLDAKGEAAEFKPNLMMGETQTGVIVARADIISSLTKKAHDAGRFETALPFALDEVDNSQMVKVLPDSGLSIAPGLGIELPQEAAIVEWNPYNKGVDILVEDQSQVRFQISDDQLYTFPSDQIAPGSELNYLNLYSTTASLAAAKDSQLHDPIPVGDVLVRVPPGEVIFACYTSTVVSKAMTLDNILETEDGIPLAILASAS